jgi:hypothetical protein
MGERESQRLPSLLELEKDEPAHLYPRVPATQNPLSLPWRERAAGRAETLASSDEARAERMRVGV